MSGSLNQDQNGVVLLLSVLITTAVGVAIGISVIAGGLILSQGSQTTRESLKAKNLANVCGETALQQIRSNTAYAGSATVTIGAQSCSYTVVAGAGENRTITAQATSGESTQRLTIQITAINPNIMVSSWGEY